MDPIYEGCAQPQAGPLATTSGLTQQFRHEAQTRKIPVWLKVLLAALPDSKNLERFTDRHQENGPSAEPTVEESQSRVHSTGESEVTLGDKVSA